MGRASRIAAIWLVLVAAATLLNSIVLFKYRFIDFLVGLSFTQSIDVFFVAMQLEPPGAPWWYTALPALVLDMPFLLVLLVLGLKAWRGQNRAITISFWIYLVDTLVFALMVAASVAVHTPRREIMWQGLTLIAHFAGLAILSRGKRGSSGVQLPA